MPEKYRNLAATTLAAAYTAGATTLTVTDPALFPASGTFRVRLGNTDKTLFRVDSVAGAVFTGAAEEFDGDAALDDVVVGVATRAAMERMLQAPAAGEVHAYSGVDGVGRYGPLWKTAPLDQSGWAWVNQGTATVVQAGGIVYLRSPATASAINLIARAGPAPTPPYTITALIANGSWSGAYSLRAGIGWRQSSDGKMIHVGYRDGGGALAIGKWNTPTSFNAYYFQKANIAGTGPVWFRITDDGANRLSQVSFDGLNFETMHTVGRTDFLTADQVMIFICPDNVDVGALSVFSWVQA